MTEMEVDAPVQPPTEEQKEHEEEVEDVAKTTKKPRFEIKKWSAVAFWSWDIDTEYCAICRNHLMDVCIDCQANPDSKAAHECTVSWGVCNHVFHSHCIARWLQSRPVCPLDNQPWELQKVGH